MLSQSTNIINCVLSGYYKEAENLYVGLGLTDEAIAMHEAAGRHTSLLRLVTKHRPQLLGAARRRVAQALQDESRYKQAEQYYIEAGMFFFRSKY
jgi:hypothetical protein